MARTETVEFTNMCIEYDRNHACSKKFDFTVLPAGSLRPFPTTKSSPGMHNAYRGCPVL